MENNDGDRSRKEKNSERTVREGPRTHDFDWVLLAIVSAICLMGMLEIYSATHDSAFAGMHWRQAIWIGVGFVAMFLISRLDYHTLLDQAPLLLLATLAHGL